MENMASVEFLPVTTVKGHPVSIGERYVNVRDHKYLEQLLFTEEYLLPRRPNLSEMLPGLQKEQYTWIYPTALEFRLCCHTTGYHPISSQSLLFCTHTHTTSLCHYVLGCQDSLYLAPY